MKKMTPRLTQKKKRKKLNNGGTMQGQIVKISSNIHYVEQNNQLYPCVPRGKFRKQHILPRVGDYVVFLPEEKVIEEILPRKNEFMRPLVSNIDQAFIVVSLKEPDFSLSLLDRFLALMELHHVKSIICLTKKDLLEEKEKKEYQKYIHYYQEIGYPIVYNDELDKIKKLISNKTSVFTGQTGVGKSTLLNRLNPEWHLKTDQISYSLGRGKHTTRTVELYHFLDGKLLDTPGFSALSFAEYSKEEIRSAFIEFALYPCVFKDCTHTNEKECCVKQAVLENKILRSRYESYLKIVKEDKVC